LRCLPVEHFVGAQHAGRCGCFRLFARPVLLTLAIVLSIAAIMPAFSSRCRRPLRSADARMSKGQFPACEKHIIYVNEKDGYTAEFDVVLILRFGY